MTNRALILAALSSGRITVYNALWSEDTAAMITCLRRLGFEVGVEDEASDPANRTIKVHGRGGKIPNGGTTKDPLELEVSNAGTAARFLAALVCLGKGAYRLTGTARMKDRPFAALLRALRELGYRIEASSGDKLPAVIYGDGPHLGAECSIDNKDSSQFASALLLAADAGGWKVSVVPDPDLTAPYVEMTKQMCDGFPRLGGKFYVEPDASSGSYFVGIDWLLNRISRTSGSRVKVANWPTSDWQIDAKFPDFLSFPSEISRSRHLGDSIMTAIVLAAYAKRAVHFTGLARLRVQECDRLEALYAELIKCGARVRKTEDTLTVEPSSLHGAEIRTYEDHRMAMCFAMLGLVIPGIVIKNPSCVKKTFPNFFQKLAAHPNHGGLGALILDASSKRQLDLCELSAV